MTHVAPLRPYKNWGDALRAQRVADDRFGDAVTAERARAGKWVVQYFIRRHGAVFVMERRVIGLREFDQDVETFSIEEARAGIPCDFIRLPRRHNDTDDLVEVYG